MDMDIVVPFVESIGSLLPHRPEDSDEQNKSPVRSQDIDRGKDTEAGGGKIMGREDEDR